MIDLTGLQGIANSFMRTPVTIRHRAAPAKDASDPTGDNTVAYDIVETMTYGWFVDKGTMSFSADGSMSVTTDEPTLRVPVGTVIGPRDKVLIGANWWTVVDASADDTWPVFTKVQLVRIE